MKNKVHYKKIVCMVAYSIYNYDSRLRRESEALVRQGYEVNFFTLAERKKPRKYVMNGVRINEIKINKYSGDSNLEYFLSYMKFFIYSLLACSKLFIRTRFDVIHIHNMPNFLVFTGVLPKLFGKKLILDIHDTMIETYEGKFRKINTKMRKILLDGFN